MENILLVNMFWFSALVFWRKDLPRILSVRLVTPRMDRSHCVKTTLFVRERKKTKANTSPPSATHAPPPPPPTSYHEL